MIATIDFETYWSQTYSLSVMSPLAYVMGSEYETISCSIKVDNEETHVVFGDDVSAALRELNLSHHGALGHNMAGFDAYILAYRYGINPKLWLDTAAMARPIHAKTCGVSLAALVRHYGIGVKDNTVLMQTRGKHLSDFTPDELRRMAIYNKDDTDQCRALFNILRPLTSAREMWQIDLTARMRTEPAFELDTALMAKTLADEINDKRTQMLSLARALNCVLPGMEEYFDDEKLTSDMRDRLMSQDKFAALLREQGVEVPMKPSPTNSSKLIPALSKTDEDFIALQEHDNPIVAGAARVRLAVKSTLLETRIVKLQEAASHAGGMLPMPIRYAGADTTGRDSGEEYNPLNFPRVDKDRPRRMDALRKSLRAPKGKKVVVADLSNIELRVNHTLWKVKRSMDLWKSNPRADLYLASAAARYRIEPSAVTKAQRQLAKIEELGLGFGSGADTFRKVAKIMSGGAINLDKVMRPATPEEILDFEKLNDREWPLKDDQGRCMVLVDDPAAKSVLIWRGRYPEIVEGWAACDRAILDIYHGGGSRVDPWGLVETSKEGFVLPGYTIRYPHLRRREKVTPRGIKQEWVYGEGRHEATIYGSKADENIVQSLARQVIVDNTVEMFARTKLRPALRPYDELVYIVDESIADDMLDCLLDVMRTPPKWWPELTVWAEGSTGDNYGEAK